MERSVLLDYTSTVDSDNLPVRESLADQAQGLCIKVWLVVGRTEHSPIDHEEVRVGGRQSLALKEDRAGHRQFHESVGLTLQRTEGLQLLLHQPQVLILLVLWVVAAYI